MGPTSNRLAPGQSPVSGPERGDLCDEMSAIINKSRHIVTAMTPPTQSERVLELVRRKGIVRGTELDRLGIHRMHLKRLVDRGLLVQRSRGVYEAAEPRMSEHDSIREVVRRYPNRVQSKCTRPRACAAIADSTGRCT